ncbi:Hypothetical protein POVR1_LOCUS582 [uncultured virus]|nr:Hypothetical protein POVR1_LOCUS582 [uncultured virus]
MDAPIGVVFIHGNHKKAETWNVTESGKVIGIETLVTKKNFTMLMQIDDFNVPPLKIVQPLVAEMESRRWVIVCHSLGIIYCHELMKHLKVIGLCLIDPTPLDEVFQKKIAESSHLLSYIQEIKLKIPAKVVCHLHLNYDPNDVDQFNRKIEYFTPLTRANQRSKMIVHPNKGHMIHYTDTPKIVESINNLLSFK